jgi:hypothetical protein
MPRGKGGTRSGTIGQSYPNRSDLAGAKPAPISTVPGQTYGKAAEQQAAQRAIPMAGAPVVTPSSPAPQPQQQPQQPHTVPGALDWLRPTERPNEPVTAGLPVGPGPGPESVQGVGAAGFQHASTADLLGALSRVPGASSDVQALAQYANSGKA